MKKRRLTDDAGVDDKVCWPGIQVKPRRPRLTNFAQCQSQITTWLNSCQTHHADCGAAQASRLPTRVVDVGTDDDPSISLHESHDDQRAAYVALSHCWGGATTVPQTNSSNIHQHRNCVPSQVLSKTFTDAIEVTRGLNIRYLWIDSLCIIQGCEEDWSIEAARMGEVYSQSFLTLAAVSSADSNGGLFQGPDIREIRLGSGFGDNPGCWLRLPFRNELFSTLHSTINTACEYPLPVLTRKWAFQERLLSRRTIYFGEEELAWECRSVTLCQCEPETHSKPARQRRFARGVEVQEAPPLKHAFTLAALSSGRQCTPLDMIGYQETPLRARLVLWERIVKEYTLRRVTFSKDNLPALSGIARAFATAELGDYHAGLWDSLSLRLLGWFQPISMRRRLSQRPADAIAPSWSWAAVECPIDFIHFTREYARVLGMVTRARGPDRFGDVDVATAVLELDAPAFPAKMEQRHRKGHGKFRSVSFYNYSFSFEEYLTSFDTDHFLLDYQLSSPTLDVWLACLGSFGSQPTFLVLVDLCHGKYERIGLVSRNLDLVARSDKVLRVAGQVEIIEGASRRTFSIT